MGPGVGNAPEGRSATRAYLGLVVEMASMNARASLLALTPPTGMRALPDPPQHTQRRDLALTSTCHRSWTARPARDVGCSCTSISRLCSPRHAGGCHERYEGTTSAGNGGWGVSCASRAAKATRSDFSGRRALTYLGVACRAEHRGKPAKAAECALCCCRRGERSQPRRIRARRARLRPAAWLAASVRRRHRRAPTA